MIPPIMYNEDQAELMENLWQTWIVYDTQVELDTDYCDIIYDLWIKREIGICVEY